LSVPDKATLGLLYADSPTFENTFKEEHLNLLTTLASVASLGVEKAALVEERFHRQRLEQELKLATEIQQRFQPTAPPIVNGYEFQGISFSCYEIGGDYYDFIQREDGKTLIALGDVSGKGTGAALLMSSLHAAIHAQVTAGSSLDETVESVNFYLSANTPTNRFVTLFFAELNHETGELQYINAGHNPPLLQRANGEVIELESSGLPLGIVPVAEYAVWDNTLKSGDALVIFSDGVSEAVNAKGEEFGLPRLKEAVKASKKKSAAGIRDDIESALSKFTQSTPANDDITLVIVKRLEAAAAA
jgi:serine phosphatase RsbU (regulator of sigma subunit)